MSMFSYLRPHNKRPPSIPSSPVEQAHPLDPPLPSVDNGHGHPQRWPNPSTPEVSASFVPRLTSGRLDASSAADNATRPGGQEGEPRPPFEDPSKGAERSRDIFSYSNHQRIPLGPSTQLDSAGNATLPNYATPQHTVVQAGINYEMASRHRPPEQKHAFVTATDIQNTTGPTSKRPIGTRQPAVAATPAPMVSTFEPAQPKSGKGRLNLLNPISLLARRRTPQALPHLAPEAPTANKTRGHVSENLDFRIRGTVVHDFSAPRPRKNPPQNDVRGTEVTSSSSAPYQRSPNPQGDSNVLDDNSGGPWSGGSHAPVFTENFEEEQYPAAGPHVRKADDLTDLQLPKPPYAKGAQRSVELNLLGHQGSEPPQMPGNINAQDPLSDVGPPVPPKAPQPMPGERKRVSIDPGTIPPNPKLSSRKSRPRLPSEVSDKDVPIPKHMKSTSSRFSFDMIGAAEQERLLEDRHRQRALEKKSQAPTGDEQDDGIDDYFDYDNMDDDDGLEEKIPGVNADFDEDDDVQIPPTGRGNAAGNLSAFMLQQPWLATPLSPSTPGMVQTPRDANGDVIGFAVSRNSPHLLDTLDPNTMLPLASPSQPHIPSPIIDTQQGLGLQSINTLAPPKPESTESAKEQVETQQLPQPARIDDDDLYFDDGMITDPGDDEVVAEFDESIFDNIDTDKYGRPLKPMLQIPTLYSPPTLSPDPPESLNSKPQVDNEDGKGTTKVAPQGSFPSEGGLAPRPSVSKDSSTQAAVHVQPTLDLTQDSLAAYQSALAAAAFTAAANGKFRRGSSPPFPTLSEQEETQPGLVSDSSHNSYCEPFSPNYDMEDDFDYDDALEDDPIIAAANAEALANDCDGFYGQEFGFYSAPAAGEAEYANGGYFGNRGMEGVNRSQSGRIVSREPNLTPITERSEYSNRNSFMSPAMYASGSIVSPGLAQLAGMMSSQEYEGGDISLNALLKLRRGAWGGSQASLHSSNESPKSSGEQGDASPIGGLPPWAPTGVSGTSITPATSASHKRKNSGVSFISEAASETGVQTDGSSGPTSPNMAMGMSALDLTNSSTDLERESKDDDQKFQRHKHSASAESISYLKEEDHVGGPRWILERRRTGESGQVLELEREVVQGGRI